MRQTNSKYQRFLVILFFLLLGTKNAHPQGIVDAVVKGDASRVKHFLDEDCSLAQTDPDSYLQSVLPHPNFGNLINLAAFFDHPDESEIVGLLIKCGVSPNTRSGSGSTPLIMAATFGREKLVSVLLKNSADPRLTNNDGATALHGAAAGGYSSIVRSLLKAGAPLWAQDREEKTALDYAQMGDQTDVVLILRNFVPPKTPSEIADSLTMVSSTFARNGKYKEAIETSRQAIRIRPSVAAYEVLCQGLIETGKGESALKEMSLAFSGGIDLPSDFLDRCAQTLMDRGKDSLAEPFLLHSGSSSADNLLSQIYLREGKIEAARELLIRALGNSSMAFDSACCVQLVQLDLRLGEYKDAIDHLVAISAASRNRVVDSTLAAMLDSNTLDKINDSYWRDSTLRNVAALHSAASPKALFMYLRELLPKLPALPAPSVFQSRGDIEHDLEEAQKEERHQININTAPATAYRPSQGMQLAKAEVARLQARLADLKPFEEDAEEWKDAANKIRDLEQAPGFGLRCGSLYRQLSSKLEAYGYDVDARILLMRANKLDSIPIVPTKEYVNPNEKSPVLATALGILIPSAGQWYVGKYGRLRWDLGLLALGGLGLLCQGASNSINNNPSILVDKSPAVGWHRASVIFYVLAVMLDVYAIVDAPLSAMRYNRELNTPTWFQSFDVSCGDTLRSFKFNLAIGF